MFLETEKNVYLATFNSEEVSLSLAYLADTSEVINVLNLKLQGKDTIMIAHCDAIKTFIDKLQLWKRRILKRNTASFPRLNEVVNEKNFFSDSLKTGIEDHLEGLENEFYHYFLNISDRSFVFNLARNPVSMEVEDVPEA
ncbi:zinc finger BED domain-containing protein 5-like [Homarus americanus]|uniref:zinc finger BED domain-containing protein 5-like n=1 Tax=Homarus americanus TaxID=6706 RepID=UPI001C4569C8|nr:zinc finger BED domain-containing protein 5-like [Homarus americanus]